MPHIKMTHSVDPKQSIIDAIGDISDLKVLHNHVIAAVYIRPEKTSSGIYLPDTHRDEDKFQSKVGLIIAFGDKAFQEPTGVWDWGDIKLHDWIVFRPSDGWNLSIRGKDGGSVLCRRLQDTSIEGVIKDPDMVW